MAKGWMAWNDQGSIIAPRAPVSGVSRRDEPGGLQLRSLK